MPADAALPTGTITFLFTDVEGSTKLWERHPDQMRVALTRHDALIEAAVADHDGVVVRPRGEGDSRFAVFSRASDAVAAAAAIQQALHEEPWPAETPLRVRVALHTGEADLREGDYYGSAVNRCARLRAIAHGGQTVLSQAAYDLVRDTLPPGVSLKDLGEQRLSDLARPERVFQLVAPGPVTEFPPLRSLDALPHNLPLQLTSFIGREQELATIKELLSTHRLVTLTGPGGTGKTRLALQVAADLLPDYPDGVWLVELAALPDPGLVPQAVAAAAGVREEAGRPLVATLVDALKPKRVLLLLDNCEHLLDACAQLADTLLRTCPHVRILTTSREALGIAGETAWRVPSLALPDLRQLPTMEALTQFEAVKLFIDRAVAAQPTFRVTNQNAPAVAQICQRLDGIPLAIELAAARARILPPEQLLARLEDRFRLLTGGSRTALERHKTLQAAVDWSYNLLCHQEKTFFNRLFVFAGGWTLEAAEQVCAGERIESYEVLDLLTRLVDKSLVAVEEQADGTARYRLLETLRQYAREKLAGRGEADALCAKHARHFLDLAERAEPELHGPAQGEWAARLDREHENLCAALEWCHEDPGGAETALKLAVALVSYWSQRGLRSEGRRWLDATLARDPPTTGGQGAQATAALRAAALAAAGRMAWRQGDPHKATPRLEAAAAEFRALGDLAGLAGVLYSLGAVAYLTGDYAIARSRTEECLALARESGDQRLRAFALLFRGAILARIGEYVAARPLLEEAQQLARAFGDEGSAQLALTALAIAAFGEGNLAHARQLLKDCLTYSERVGRWPTVGFNLTFLGRIARLEGDFAQARRHYAAGLPKSRDAGDLPSIVWSIEEWAGLAVGEGHPERAAHLFGAAQSLLDAAALVRQPFLRAVYERDLAAARVQLDDRFFAAAWAEGQAMSLEQAIAYALEGAPEPADEVPTPA